MKKILQAFKRLFSKSIWASREHIYVCDPSRNVKCSKEGCWYISKGPCRCTTKKSYAQLDNSGKPKHASDEEAYNLEWVEQQFIL